VADVQLLPEVRALKVRSAQRGSLLSNPSECAGEMARLVPVNARVFTIDFHLRRILGPLFLLPAFANLLKIGGGSERLFPQRP
jgi:hypothetical protein